MAQIIVFPGIIWVQKITYIFIIFALAYLFWMDFILSSESILMWENYIWILSA